MKIQFNLNKRVVQPWRFFVVITVSMASIPSEILANNLAPCGRSFNEDSAGRGVEKGFRGTGGKPKHVNEVCYNEGFDRGQELRNKNKSLGCDSDFDDSFERGFKGLTDYLGSECSQLGFEAGRAMLRSSARERLSAKVGSDCIAAYEGACRAKSSPGYSYLKLQICSDTGLGDLLFVEECQKIK